MIVHPIEEYTLTRLEQWFESAQELNEVLIIDPCNPTAPKMLQTRATIRDHDGLAGLTQWLGGLKP